MTIQDALERAKQMRRIRETSAPPRSEAAQVVRRDSSSLAVRREHTPSEPVAAPIQYSELERIEFDASSCERNKILFTDAQLAEAGRAAAAYRLLRGRVLHRAKASGWSCIGITSPGPGEGKTLTAMNLAISIARERQRTVYLLDLDMRNPSALESVGARPERFLSQYFAEGLEADRVLFNTTVDNLVIGGNLEPVIGASELLASPRLDDLISYVRRRSPGALVIVDLPPVLSTDEALVVAPRTDAMFLVVAEGVTRRDGLARATDLLSDFTVAGVILNRSSERLGADYYGY